MMASANDRQSRRELLDTISEQKDQIGRYEARLRDVVRAYKGLVKEKEALESSIKILGTNAAPTSTAGAESEGKKQNISKVFISLSHLLKKNNVKQSQFWGFVGFFFGEVALWKIRIEMFSAYKEIRSKLFIKKQVHSWILYFSSEKFINFQILSN